MVTMAAPRPPEPGPEDTPLPGTWFDRLPLLVALGGSLALLALVLIVVTVDPSPAGMGAGAQAEESCMATGELARWYTQHPEAQVLSSHVPEEGRVCLIYLPGPGKG